MARSNGHQAMQAISYGQYEFDAASGKGKVTNVKSYPGPCVTAPEGTSSTDWINAGFPGAACEPRS
jgi:branched-chain amino acid transport system substrate-binding protein